MPRLKTDSRRARVERKTNETHIAVALCLDGSGKAEIDTGIGFFDHMLAHVARHSLIDLEIRAVGDLEIDDHHTVEDVGIVLGSALKEALGDRSGIARYGHAVVPMDEALVLCALDISGRGLCVCNLTAPVPQIGGYSTQMTPEFFRATAHNAGWTLHIRQLSGENAHHIAEGAFKAFGRALRQAIEIDPRVKGVPSTKGLL